MSWSTYFAKQIEIDRAMPTLEPMPVQCHDCAVPCLYGEIAEALSGEPQEVREQVSLKWWCHNNPRRACRGNWDINMPAEPRGGG